MEFSSNPLVLVFCNTREDVETLSGALTEQENIPAEAMHGGLNQFQRENVVCNFSERKVSVLVTTDILGRGIDIKGVTHVFNYDMPKGDSGIDKYVSPKHTHTYHLLPRQPPLHTHTTCRYSQRIGRTGRAGAKGDAVSFVIPAEDEDILFYLKKKVCLIVHTHTHTYTHSLRRTAKRCPTRFQETRRRGSTPKKVERSLEYSTQTACADTSVVHNARPTRLTSPPSSRGVTLYTALSSLSSLHAALLLRHSSYSPSTRPFPSSFLHLPPSLPHPSTRSPRQVGSGLSTTTHADHRSHAHTHARTHA